MSAFAAARPDYAPIPDDEFLVVANDSLVGLLKKKISGREWHRHDKVYRFGLLSCIDDDGDHVHSIRAIFSDRDGTEFGSLLPLPRLFAMKCAGPFSGEDYERHKREHWPILIQRPIAVDQ